MIPRARLVLAAFVGCLALAANVRAGEARPIVAAAANLQYALPEILKAFNAQGGGAVRIVSGASGNLARQIIAGAPFELFIAADEPSVKAVVDARRAAGTGMPYAVGRLALFAPSGSQLALDPDLAGLALGASKGTIRRVVIANPESAPYGRAAREALQSAGAWQPLTGRIALGESVNQAAQLALVGGVDAALLPQSIVMAEAFAGKGQSVIVNASRHAPIVQSMVLLQGAGAVARALHAFILGAEARRILARYGFGAPE